MTVTCPHCGIAFDAYGAPAHVASCLQRPGAIDLARRLLERDDMPGCAVSARAYAELSIAYNAQAGDGLRAPAQRQLSEAFGGWRGVCEWAGLRFVHASAGRKRPSETDILDEVDAAAQAARADLDEARDYSGLPVCAVRTLPDGRTAYMLR